MVLVWLGLQLQVMRQVTSMKNFWCKCHLICSLGEPLAAQILQEWPPISSPTGYGPGCQLSWRCIGKDSQWFWQWVYSFNSFPPLSLWSPVLHCVRDPPVTSCITTSRKYIFNLPGCERREPSYTSEKLNLGNLTASKSDCFPCTYTGISSNSWALEIQQCKSTCYSTFSIVNIGFSYLWSA